MESMIEKLVRGTVAMSMLIAGNASSTELGDLNSKVPTAGYFPSSFPRDPVDVNLYLEHVLLGQILEPLVQTSKDGKLVPAVAARWAISENGKLITFSIREGLTFSDGRKVTAADVKFSLERHLRSKNSQSKAYLTRIKNLQEVSEREIRLELESPYIAIFKALGRDQLGIVPSGWKFDPKSDEPFVGTGPYRAVRKNGTWELTVNEHFRSFSDVKVKKWKLVLGDPNKHPAIDQPVPDLVPFAPPEMSRMVQERTAPDDFSKERLNHFVQVSAWWCPHGKLFADLPARSRAMRAIADLLELRRESLHYGIATGIVPQGVPGYLPIRPPLPEIAGSKSTLKRIRVAVLENQFSDLNATESLRKVEEKWELTISLESIPATELAALPSRRPDVVVFGYAGGFLDPEGFLTVITASLGADLQTIFGDSHSLYERASADQDWSERRELYQKLNHDLVVRQVVAPGWRPDIFSFVRKTIARPESSLSYVPRFNEFQYAAGK